MKKQPPTEWVWEYEIPLFSREMQWTWLKVMLITGGLFAGLLALALGSGGHWQPLGGLLLVLSGVVAGIYLTGLLVMVVVFRGHNRVRYTVDEAGILCEVIDRSVKRSNRLAVILGVVLLEPRLLGAGLTSASAESTQVLWSGNFELASEPQRHTLRFKNGWRTLMTVYCTADNYAAVSEVVKQRIHRVDGTKRQPLRSPLPGYLLRSVGVVLVCLPLFFMAKTFSSDLLAPIITLCFAFATVWLVEIFGYVVLGSLLIQWIQVATRLLEVRQSWLRPGKPFRAWEVMGGDKITVLAWAGLATLVLAIYAWRAARGRYRAVLTQDHIDMGEGQ